MWKARVRGVKTKRNNFMQINNIFPVTIIERDHIHQTETNRYALDLMESSASHWYGHQDITPTSSPHLPPSPSPFIKCQFPSHILHDERKNRFWWEEIYISCSSSRCPCTRLRCWFFMYFDFSCFLRHGLNYWWMYSEEDVSLENCYTHLYRSCFNVMVYMLIRWDFSSGLLIW